MKQNNALKHVVIFIAGLMFAVGLGVAGMTQPTKVIGFLDILGDWDPSLLVVLGVGTSFTFVMFQFVLRRPNPVMAEAFSLPTRKDIDFKLVAGASLFGAGWGLGGFCPGPALVASASVLPGVFAFLGAMAAGSFVYAYLTR